ncbi:FtsX-like permease family protein [Acidipila sp. EB88]|uniref:FtsX-like permease family protein n=1 Tax=Acidipila sp. EB88 TaxID=2305226 RepID=UPI000F5FC461|nr:FtsX-like permease family protein [Acidipila sp. EB88]RRA50173.1 ABC transporter permease [Acidipila sp. EB88]
MRFELFIAFRYLRARRRQAVIGVVTAISVAGVAVGVASLIIALAITTGMRRDLQDRLLSSTAHVSLMRVQNDGIRDWRPLTARLRTLPHVTADAPALYEPVLVSRGAHSGGALLKGILPAEEQQVSDMLRQMTAGSALALSTPAAPLEAGTAEPTPPIVLGYDLADSLDAHVGDTVVVTSPQGELTPYGLVPKYQRFQIAGVFHSGFYQYDSGFGFVRLADAQALFGEPDLVSIVSFKVDDLYHADRIGREIEQAAGPGFETTNWMEQNRELFRALKLEQLVSFIIIGLIVGVAALNILIALTMMVMEKTRDIAVLLSMGVAPVQIRRIFLLQGVLISVIGTAIGLVGGYGAAWVCGHYHLIHLSADVYSIDTLPFAPRFVDGLLVSAVSIVVALLATLYPSGAAARVLPAEALRYE